MKSKNVIDKKSAETDTIGCISTALEILGDKWSPLILKKLHENKKCRFSDIELSLPHLSPRTLSQRLDALSREGIVLKQQYCLHPPRCDYSLTVKGEALVAVLRSMAAWGEKYETGALAVSPCVDCD